MNKLMAFLTGKKIEPKQEPPPQPYDYYNDSSTLLERVLAAKVPYRAPTICKHGSKMESCDKCYYYED